MAQYDFGLRGPRDTTDPRFHQWGGDPYFGEPSRRPRDMAPTNRATARYNRDYLRPSGERYPRSPKQFASDSREPIEGETGYERPYSTRGALWTHRGAPRPYRYDSMDYGPEYGGRYPDEI